MKRAETYHTCPHCDANFRGEDLNADRTIPPHAWRGTPCPGSNAPVQEVQS